MTQDEKVELLRQAGVWDVIGFPSCIDKLFELVAAHEREKFCALLRQVHDSISLASYTNGFIRSEK